MWLVLFAVLAHIHLARCSVLGDGENPSEPAEHTGNKPNIVIIMADDVGTGDLHFWNGLNSSLVDTPNLQALASKGIVFTDAHSTPLCAPSRYMLLSGNYAHRGRRPYGTWNIHAGSNQFAKNQKSIAEVLRDQGGYETAMFGKWHLGGKIPPDGMQSLNISNILTHAGHDWSFPLIEGPGDIGFDHSYITPAGIQDPPYSFFRNDYLEILSSDAKYWRGGQYPMKSGTSVINITKEGEGDPNWDSSSYDMILVNETEAFIDHHQVNRPNDPFFAYVALGAVHIPHSPPTSWGLDGGSQVKGKYPTEHLDMVGAMDKAVGSIVQIIEDRGLAGNTLIIFTSDNGGLNIAATVEAGHETGGVLRGYKGSIWEGGHRVPLIMRWDNKVEGGWNRKRMVGLNDIYATLCEVAGVNIPAASAQDSVSFAPYIRNAKNKQGLREYLGMFQLNNQWHHAIRFNHIKLIHHPHNNTFEAYNMTKDIGEKNNIFNSTWVRSKMPLMFEKLKEIGPCPDKDREGGFNINNLMGSYNCSWFAQNSARCEQHYEGGGFCPSVCTSHLLGMHKKCVTQGMYGNTVELKEIALDMSTAAVKLEGMALDTSTTAVKLEGMALDTSTAAVKLEGMALDTSTAAVKLEEVALGMSIAAVAFLMGV